MLCNKFLKIQIVTEMMEFIGRIYRLDVGYEGEKESKIKTPVSSLGSCWMVMSLRQERAWGN